MVNVPVIGHVAAGEPLLAEQNIENYFPIPMEYMPNKQTFMLKVHGESMINGQSLDGDLVLVEQSSVADNGDIVVALLDDSATVKRFYKEEGIFRLQPENDALETLPEVLQQAAAVRLQYPDLSLTALCGCFDPAVSKSGLSHRMKKLEALADALRQRVEKGQEAEP